jgi:hypothetical protein
MNAREQDIIYLIDRHGSMTSAQLQDYLTAPRYGYNLEVEQISKIASKMKSNGLLVGEDRPNPGTKPVRYWSLPEAAEMASDVAEVEQSPETYRDTWTNPPSAEVEFKAAPVIPEPDYEPATVAFRKSPMSAAKILREFANLGMEDDRAMGVFMDGIAAAERHHGIAE